MARAYPDPWDDSQIEQVEGLLIAGNDRKAVAAVMRCKVGDLDWLCRQAFDQTFKQVADRCELEAIARLKAAAFNMATDGKNAKMLEMQLRERGLVMGPVERRRKIKAEQEAKEKETDF